LSPLYSSTILYVPDASAGVEAGAASGPDAHEAITAVIAAAAITTKISFFIRYVLL
jgi:hypothetical protein